MRRMSLRNSYRFGLLVAGVILGEAEAIAIPTFQMIRPDSPGGIVDARNISADGSTVVGTIVDIGVGSEAFRWTASEGLLRIGMPANGFLDSSAEAVSSDGTVIIGNGHDSTGPRGFRWTAQTGLVALTTPGGQPSGVGTTASDTSADGLIVAGHTTSAGVYEVAVAWNGAGVPSAFTSGDAGSHVYAVSADGGVLVGDDSVAGELPVRQVARWTPEGGKERLGLDGWARGVTPDGATIVGTAQFQLDSQQAFRWRDGVFEPLGFLPGTDFSLAEDVSANGTVIVGTANASFVQAQAFVWTQADGMRSLADVLTVEHGIDLTDWQLEYVSGISDDGKTLVGGGTFRGEAAAWVAVIPEPSTGVLVAIGLIAVGLTRRSRPRAEIQELRLRGLSNTTQRTE